MKRARLKPLHFRNSVAGTGVLQPAEGPVHWTTPWACIYVDPQGKANLHLFPLHGKEDFGQVRQAVRKLKKLGGWRRVRIISLNKSDLRR